MKLIDCSEIVFWFLCVCVCWWWWWCLAAAAQVLPKNEMGIKSWRKPAFGVLAQRASQQFNSLFLLFFLSFFLRYFDLFPSRKSFTGRGREQRRNLTIYQLSGGTSTALNTFYTQEKKKWTKAAGGIVQKERGRRKEKKKKKMEAGNQTATCCSIYYYFSRLPSAVVIVCWSAATTAAAMLLLFHLSAFVTPIYKTRVEFQIICLFFCFLFLKKYLTYLGSMPGRKMRDYFSSSFFLLLFRPEYKRYAIDILFVSNSQFMKMWFSSCWLYK